MWYSTTKLAKKEGVTSQTIRRYIEDGKYEKISKTKNGHYRVYNNVWKATKLTTVMWLMKQ